MEHDDRAYLEQKEVIGMRNVIVHDYLGVDDQVVRAVALRDLPSLIEGLRKALSAT